MTISLIVGIGIVVAVLYGIYRSTQQESHHLDDLHIGPGHGGRHT